MNNYSSGPSRPRLPGYRDEQKDFPDRFLESQDRGRVFYEHNHRSRSPQFPGHRDMPSTAFMNSRHSVSKPSEEDSGRRYMFQKHNGLASLSRYGRETSQYERRDPFAESTTQNFRNSSQARLSPSFSDRDALERERASFTNMLQLRIPPRSDTYDTSLSTFSRQKDTFSVGSFGIKMPSIDPALREKFQNHMRNEMQTLSQEVSSLHRSGSLCEKDFIYSRRDGAVNQDRLYGDLSPLKTSHQSFDREYSRDFHEHSKIPAYNDDASHLASGNSLFPTEMNCVDRVLSKHVYASGSPPLTEGPNQIKGALVLEQNSNIPGRSESTFLSKSLHDITEDFYSNEPVISTERQILKTNSPIGDLPTNQSSFQRHNSPIHLPVFETDSQSSEKQISGSLSCTTSFPKVEAAEDSENANNFLSTNSDSKDGSVNDTSSAVKSFEEDSLHKRIEVAAKSNSSVSDNSLSTDDWATSHAIPFLGETPNITGGDAISIEPKHYEKCAPRIQEVSENDDSILSGDSLNKSGEIDKIKSTLEDALETLMIKDPIVGLDYITEYKDKVSTDGGFPFHCSLCKSSISRSLIIDHIQGFKHRLKYMKLKDGISFEYIVGKQTGLTNQSLKDQYVYSASERLEKTYGRGNVIVKLESSGAKMPLEMQFGNASNNASCKPVSHEDECLTSQPFVVRKSDELPLSNNSVDKSVYGEEHLSTSSFPSDPIHDKECNQEAKENVHLNFTPDGEFSKLLPPEKPTDAEHIKEEMESDLQINPSNASTGSLKRESSSSCYDQSKKFKEEPWSRLDASCSASKLLSSSDVGSLNNTSKSPSQVLEELWKCEINSDEEAKMVLKSIHVLMKLLLRYNLRHIANEDVENVIKSLESKPLENIDKLLHLMKIKLTTSILNENDKLRLNSDFSIKGKGNLASSSNALDSTFDVEAPRAAGNTQTPSDVSNRICNVDPKSLSNKAIGVNSSSSALLPPMNASWLQPPPFFQWPDTNTAPGLVQNSNLAWSAAYQSSLQSFYQQQGYGAGSALYPRYPVAVPLFQPSPPTDVAPPPLPPSDSSLLKPPLPPSNSPLPKPPPPPSGGAPPNPPLPPPPQPMSKHSVTPPRMPLLPPPWPPS